MAKDYQNRITGSDGDNILMGGSKDDTLSGGRGNDTYLLTGNWGHDTINENANEGTDTIDFSGVVDELTFIFDLTSVLVSDASGNTLSSGSQVENYLGGLGDDHFVFKNGAKVLGKIEGNQGTNTLDFSLYDTGRNFILTGVGTVEGMKGKEIAILGSFDNISKLIGGGAEDSLTGLDANAVWSIGHVGYRYTANGQVLEFSLVGNLIGGTGSDTFAFENGAVHGGSIQGGAGIDLLDYSAYTEDLMVNLATGTATGVTGSIPGIENVTGGSGNDEIIGDMEDNILIGGAGNDILHGGAGNDTYIFRDGSGEDLVYEADNEGMDTLEFISVTEDLTITITLDGIDVLGAGMLNKLSYLGSSIETLRSGLGDDKILFNSDSSLSVYGGGGNDVFRLADGVVVKGELDGEEGSDLIDLSDYTTPRKITLTGLGNLDGFRGYRHILSPGLIISIRLQEEVPWIPLLGSMHHLPLY